MKLVNPNRVRDVLLALGVDPETGTYVFRDGDLTVDGRSDAEITAAEKSLDIAALNLSDAKDRKLAQLAADYQAALEAGVSYQGAMFESDDHSQLELAKVLTAVANGWTLPAGFAWVDANNQPHSVPDVAWLQGLAAALADHKAALFARLQAAKAAVRAATTVAAVNKVAL